MPREPKQELIDLGRRIKAAREDARLTQQQVINRLNEQGVHVVKSALGHWESGRNDIPVSTLIVLANVLKVEVNYLIGRSIDEDFLNQDPFFRRYFGLDPAKRGLINSMIDALYSSDSETTTHGRKAE